MAFKILFYILPLVLVSCSQLSKEECQKSSVAQTAFENGAGGTVNRYYRLKRKCKKNDELESVYNKSYASGLLKFCTLERGIEQASLGLKKETSCLSSTKYTDGYLKELERFCNTSKAKTDARKLLNSDNRLCLLVPKYKRAYLNYLTKQCSYKKGYSIGLLKKDIDQNCKDAKNFSAFEKGYKNGLSRGYEIENRSLQKSVLKLQSKRTALQKKISRTDSPEKNQKNRIDLNVLESKVLGLEHQIEKNKRFIN